MVWPGIFFVNLFCLYIHFYLHLYIHKLDMAKKEVRDKAISLRLSETELSLVDQVCKERKGKGLKYTSRSDLLVIASKFLFGEITQIDLQ